MAQKKGYNQPSAEVSIKIALRLYEQNTLNFSMCVDLGMILRSQNGQIYHSDGKNLRQYIFLHKSYLEIIIITHRLLIIRLISPKGFVALVCNVEKHTEESCLISNSIYRGT